MVGLAFVRALLSSTPTGQKDGDKTGRKGGVDDDVMTDYAGKGGASLGKKGGGTSPPFFKVPAPPNHGVWCSSSPNRPHDAGMMPQYCTGSIHTCMSSVSIPQITI
jgi:hypothetical protein